MNIDLVNEGLMLDTSGVLEDDDRGLTSLLPDLGELLGRESNRSRLLLGTVENRRHFACFPDGLELMARFALFYGQ
mgnify:CR=1 FL=1